MAVIVTHEDLVRLQAEGDKSLIHWAYNALDCAVTHEVHSAMPALTTGQTVTYEFEHACQAPAITMTLRGLAIDGTRRAEAIDGYEAEEIEAETLAAQLAATVWNAKTLRIGACGDRRAHLWPRGLGDTDPDKLCKRCGATRLVPSPLNSRSAAQVAELLYDKLGVRERRDRGTGRRTTDDEALESIRAQHARHAVEMRSEKGRNTHARIAAIVEQIIKARKARKQIGYARSSLGPTNRMHSAFNVGATETGRWSASKAPDWTGWNCQQIGERLRRMVVADPGLELFYADFKSAESQVVAFDARDLAYIEAHASGDVHTTVCQMVWPDFDYGENPREVAERPTDFDPHHSYRDYTKHVQHGGNIGQSAVGMARDAHISLEHAEEVYRRMYEDAFPHVRARQSEIRSTVERERALTIPLGRTRQFLGRTWSDEVQREALAYTQQGTVADLLNLALFRVWRELDTRVNIFDRPHPDQPNRVWLLAQMHDAILGLVRPGDDATLRRVHDLMVIPILIHGRECVIPVEIAVGPSWSKKEMRVWSL